MSDGTSDGQKDTDGKKDDAKDPDADDGASEKKTDSGSDASGTDAEDDSKNSPADAKDSDDGDSGQTAGSTHQSYTIHEGDTITSISMRYYGNSSKIKEICALNGLSPEDFIFPGQKILLP